MSQNIKTEFLEEIVTILQKGMNSEETFEAVFNLIENTVPFDSATLFLYKKEEDELEPIHRKGEERVELAEQISLDRGTGLSSWISRQKDPVVLQSLKNARPGKDDRFNSFLSLPLWVGEKLIGVLNLGHNSENAYTDENIDKYRVIATQLSNIVEKIKLRNEVVKKNRLLKNTIKKLKETQQELVEKERLAAVGEVAVTVNHKINNPLTNIIGLAEVLEVAYKAGKDEKVKEGLQGILKEAKRIKKFTHKLSEAEKIEKKDYVGEEQMLDIEE